MKVTTPDLFQKTHTNCHLRSGNFCLKWEKTNNVKNAKSFMDYCCGFMTSKGYSDCGMMAGCTNNSCRLSKIGMCEGKRDFCKIKKSDLL